MVEYGRARTGTAESTKNSFWPADSKCKGNMEFFARRGRSRDCRYIRSMTDALEIVQRGTTFCSATGG